jgi:hypothetical protein
MSDLQIALAVLGAVVVAAVYAYNAWQERALRRRLERAFAGQHEDVLLKRTEEAAAAPRIEPRLGGEPGAAATARVAAGGDLLPAGADPLIECVAVVECAQAPGEAALRELQQAIAIFGKPARLLGEDAAAGGWRVLGRDAKGGYRRLQAALQLANRSGPLHAPQLNGFCDALRGWCARHEARLELPDTAETLKAAQALDAFCGETDVAIGINVVAQPGSAFTGNEVREAAAAEGFTLEPDGVFYRSDAAGETLFTLENHQPQPFLAGAIESLQTPGLTLLLDLPRVADAEAVLDEMAASGQRLAESLGGLLVDDNRVPLQAPGLARIKAQLREIQAAMAAREIPAGGPRARRLFA